MDNNAATHPSTSGLVAFAHRAALGAALGAALVASAAGAASDVAASADQVRPPLVGSSAPDVELRTIDGESVSLPELVAQKPTILIFYRGGW